MSDYRPIEDYALIGDGYTAALVSTHGSIEWACFPRFDSGAVFARILDARKGGHWTIEPVQPYNASRRYMEDTNVLITTFTLDGGHAEADLIDFMPIEAGRHSGEGSSIIRILHARRGAIDFRVTFEPRFDYARARTAWAIHGENAVRAFSGDRALTLYAPVRLEVPEDGADGRAEGICRAEAGRELAFALTYRSPKPLLWRTDALRGARQQLDDTADFWRGWIARCTYRGPHLDMVRRSVLVLKLLDYAPTGAIIAAPTTSLPEHIGGVRNWDYRYAWIRDTAFVLYAFYLTGYQEEGEAFFQWVLDLGRQGPASLQVLYGVGGERRIDEEELPHLEGYRHSAPVRIGNAAYTQRQLDIYGDILDCALLSQKYAGGLSDDLWPFLRSVVDHVCEVWTEPDFGIWEVRSEPRHFLYSKAMCWVALDRGIRLARSGNRPAPLEKWEPIRDAIMTELLEQGYDEEVGAFTQAYGTKALDAAALVLQLRKVVAADDPRMRSTVDRVAEELGEDGLIHRYLPEADDGLPGGEGAFLMCSFWLVDCYAEMGRLDEARELFDRLLGLANDVGLYSEEFDPDARRFLGNHPQAFTHVALVNAAVALHRAETRSAGPGAGG